MSAKCHAKYGRNYMNAPGNPLLSGWTLSIDLLRAVLVDGGALAGLALLRVMDGWREAVRGRRRSLLGPRCALRLSAAVVPLLVSR